MEDGNSEDDDDDDGYNSEEEYKPGVNPFRGIRVGAIVGILIDIVKEEDKGVGYYLIDEVVSRIEKMEVKAKASSPLPKGGTSLDLGAI